MYRLALLGRVELRDAARAECRPVLKRRKLLALLVYLAVARPRGFHRRDRLIGVFWPDLNQTRARNALRQAVHHLRGALGPEVLSTRGDDELSINPDMLSCDMVDFNELLDSAHAAEALDLVRGELLPGFHLPETPEFERWLEEERGSLRLRAAAAARGLALEQGENLVGATHWARRALQLAPYDEQVMRQLLGALDRAGDRAGAVEEYERFARRLELELSVEPAPETQALMSAIRTRVENTSGDQPRLASPPGEAEPQAQPTLHARRRVHAGRRALLGATAVTAAALLWALWPRNARVSATVLNGGRPSLVVLPFEDLSAGSGQVYFASGLTIELIGEFARVRQLRVISAPSAMRFRRTLLSPGPIADSLHVSYLLESSVDRGDDRIRVNARLIRARPEALVWSNTYEGEAPGMFAMLRDLAQGALRALAIESGSSPGAARPPARQVSANVYDAYLMGLHDASGSDVDQAIHQFERAIALDSTFAPALAALARAYDRQLYFDQQPQDDAGHKAEVAARTALALDESLIDAHVALGNVLALAGHWPDAEGEFQRAIELGPGDSGARRAYAWYLCLVGRYDAAVAQVREARRLDPLSWGGGADETMGASLVCARRE